MKRALIRSSVAVAMTLGLLAPGVAGAGVELAFSVGVESEIAQSEVPHQILVVGTGCSRTAGSAFVGGQVTVTLTDPSGNVVDTQLTVATFDSTGLWSLYVTLPALATPGTWTIAPVCQLPGVAELGGEAGGDARLQRRAAPAQLPPPLAYPPHTFSVLPVAVAAQPTFAG